MITSSSVLLDTLKKGVVLVGQPNQPIFLIIKGDQIVSKVNAILVSTLFEAGRLKVHTKLDINGIIQYEKNFQSRATKSRYSAFQIQARKTLTSSQVAMGFRIDYLWNLYEFQDGNSKIKWLEIKGSIPKHLLIDSEDAFEAAMFALGPWLASIVFHVICLGTYIQDAEVALSWPARSGKIVLAIALDQLVTILPTEEPMIG